MDIKLFIQGTRPKTLVAAIIPTLVAGSLAYSQNGTIDFFIALMCLLLALFIQIATNFYNDAIDFKKGADVDRVGPSRLATQNNISFKKIMIGGHLFLIFAFICGIPLVMKGGIVFLILGLISLFFAYGYTGGPFPLAYLGLGELFVFIFFGHVAVGGTYYLLTLEYNLAIFILSTVIGFLSCSLIAINNLRDRATDIKVNKRTLATKMQKQSFINVILFFIYSPFVLSLYFVTNIKLSYIALIFAIGIAHEIRQILFMYSENSELNRALGQSGKLLAVFGILFFVASLWN